MLIGIENDKIRCEACKSEFTNCSDTLSKHLLGPRHKNALERFKNQKIEEESIRKSVESLTTEVEALKIEQDSFRTEVVETFYRAGDS